MSCESSAGETYVQMTRMLKKSTNGKLNVYPKENQMG